ncbi:hypothetical protein L1080_034655 [Rhodococcus sp. MSC1_016]|jgi:hypothetical protein|uniref:hypothetical protein n=1 Tax=Rhodococcus sp. MSC1_016 TaxID=2909266 RepID=UPI002030EFEB|nr:hypothetical protein [Rhodococcus sp. MSC1_016]
MNLIVRPSGPDDVSVLRGGICIATVVACLPYLLLKVAWIMGWTIGVEDAGFADTTRVANLATSGMELVAIVIAIGLVASWGRKIPAFAIAFPVWVATGLLVPVAVGSVLGGVIQAVTGGGNAYSGNDEMAGWVFGLVYGGFALQSVLLLAGFVLYARDRWAVVADGGRMHDGAGKTRPLQNLLGAVFVVAATIFALQQLSWAVWGGGMFSDLTTAQRVFLVAGALSAVAGAAAVVGLLRGKRLTISGLTLIWLGTSVTFTSALKDTLTTLAVDAEAWGASRQDPGNAALTLLVLLGAFAGAIGGALRLVEEVSPASEVSKVAA